MGNKPNVFEIEGNDSALNLYNAISNEKEKNTHSTLNLVTQRAIEFLRDNEIIEGLLLSYYSSVLEKVSGFGMGFDENANSGRTEYKTKPEDINGFIFAAIVFNMGKDDGMEVKMTTYLSDRVVELKTFRICISKDQIDVFEE